MDIQQFEWAKEYSQQDVSNHKGIGTFKERSLHAILKYYLEPDHNYHEIKTSGFVADIRREDKIIEIQTRQFAKLRKKLACFLESYQVKIVYPISHIKYLSWIDIETGEMSAKRKSPKRGSVYQAFFELYALKDLLHHPNLSFCVMLIDMEEYKLLNGWSYDKKRGAYRKDRVPIKLIEEIHIDQLQDYEKLIPKTLDSLFTSKDFKEHTKLSLRSAQMALNVLYVLGLVERVDKQGNAYVYKRQG